MEHEHSHCNPHLTKIVAIPLSGPWVDVECRGIPYGAEACVSHRVFWSEFSVQILFPARQSGFWWITSSSTAASNDNPRESQWVTACFHENSVLKIELSWKLHY